MWNTTRQYTSSSYALGGGNIGGMVAPLNRGGNNESLNNPNERNSVDDANKQHLSNVQPYGQMQQQSQNTQQFIEEPVVQNQVHHMVSAQKVDTYKSRPQPSQNKSGAQFQHELDIAQPLNNNLVPVQPGNNSANHRRDYQQQQNQYALVLSQRPIIASRNVIINRSGPESYRSGSTSRLYQDRMTVRSGGANLGSMAVGTYASAATSGVGAVMESRDKEKRDMQDLNERLANYLEKVRFLEAQNRNLVSELERLKQKWGQETSQVKVMYQTELDEARKLLDEAGKDKGRLEIKVASLEDVNEELKMKLEDALATAADWKNKWERGLQQVSEAEAETAMMRRRMDGLDIERDRDKKMIIKLQDALTRVRQDLDNESLLHIDAAGRLQTLEEEIEFMKSVHEQEMKELAMLINKDVTTDNRAYWKSEMGAALKEIQDMYEDKMDLIRTELETSYSAKVQEFRSGVNKNNMESVHSKEESKRLKTTMVELRDKLSILEGQNLGLQRELEALRRDSEHKERELERENEMLKNDVVKLRAEIDAVMNELHHIMDSKLGLELEIAAYRKLLEGEEIRIGEIETNLAQGSYTLSHSGGGTSVVAGNFDGNASDGPSSGIMIGASSDNMDGGGLNQEGGVSGGRMGASSSGSVGGISGGGISGGGGGSFGGSGGGAGGRAGENVAGFGGGSGTFTTNVTGGKSGGAAGSSSMSGAGGRAGYNLPNEELSPGGYEYSTVKSESTNYRSADSSKMGSNAPLGGGLVGNNPKYSYQKSSKGPCAIADASHDGKFVVIENNGRKEENLGSWIIKRIINEMDQLQYSQYVLEPQFSLKPNSKIKLWSQGSKPINAPRGDIEVNMLTWGSGDNVTTKLISPSGEEKASFVQRSAY